MPHEMSNSRFRDDVTLGDGTYLPGIIHEVEIRDNVSLLDKLLTFNYEYSNSWRCYRLKEPYLKNYGTNIIKQAVNIGNDYFMVRIPQPLHWSGQQIQRINIRFCPLYVNEGSEMQIREGNWPDYLNNRMNTLAVHVLNVRNTHDELIARVY